VDKPFLMWGSAPRPGKPCKGLKKSFTKRTCLFYSFGYLEPCKKLVDDLNSRGIKASLFFQQRGCTPSNPASDIRYAQSDCRLIKTKVANKDFAQELMKHGHSIGLHAVHTKDYNDFLRDMGRCLYFYSKSSKGAI